MKAKCEESWIQIVKYHKEQGTYSEMQKAKILNILKKQKFFFESGAG